MINEIELYVCDEDDIVLLSDGRDTHVCMECEKPMTLAKFERKLTLHVPDPLRFGGLCICGKQFNHQGVCAPEPAGR